MLRAPNEKLRGGIHERRIQETGRRMQDFFERYGLDTLGMMRRVAGIGEYVPEWDVGGSVRDFIVRTVRYMDTQMNRMYPRLTV